MLNGRLYFQAWFVATIALLVAFLTLQPQDELMAPESPGVFDGQGARAYAEDLTATAPLRVPGTESAEAGSRWMRDQMAELPAGHRLVAQQQARVRVQGDQVPITNVMYTVGPSAPTQSARNIVVVAPRDSPRQVAGNANASAVLLELARVAAQSQYHHTIIFLSVDGDTLGNAGLRWYLNSVDTSRIAGMVVLDAVGGDDGNEVHIWSGGAHRQALGLRQAAEQSVRDAGGVPTETASLTSQLIAMAVPETRGAQRAAIDMRVPAVTLSARREGPLPAGMKPPASSERLRLVGNAALHLVGRLDVRERARTPDASFAYAGRILRPSVARLALLLLALPLFVMALDAAARIRRARVRVSTGLRAVGWRCVPPLAALFLGHVLTLTGVLAAPSVGRPPLPADMAFTRGDGLALLLVVLTAAAVAVAIRGRIHATGANPPAEASAALLWLSVLILLAWWKSPYTLVLILPAAHAALAATVVPRRWQLVALAGVALAAPIAVIMAVSQAIDRNVWFTLWYLLQTSMSGARGFLGPVLLVLVGVCVVSLGSLVLFRARKGLIGRRWRRQLDG